MFTLEKYKSAYHLKYTIDGMKYRYISFSLSSAFNKIKELYNA